MINMTFNLQNFFKYYDEHNVNHVAGVGILEKAIPNLLKPEADWVVTYRGSNTGEAVDLHKFFQFFSEKNANHVAAVNQLQKETIMLHGL